MAHHAGGDDSFDSVCVELTPESLRCSIGACPSIFKTVQGKFVIIGKKPSPEITETIENKIGDDEWAIVIDPELLSEI